MPKLTARERRADAAFALPLPPPPPPLPNVVVLPGVDGTLLCLDALTRALGMSRTQAISLSPTNNASPRALAAELRPMIQARCGGAGGCVVVAQSFCGHAALRLAAGNADDEDAWLVERPSGLRGVVLVNSFVSPPVAVAALRGPAALLSAAVQRTQADELGIPGELLARVIAVAAPPPVAVLSRLLCGGRADVARALRETLLNDVPTEALAARLAVALRADSGALWRDRVALPAQRTLVLRGAADRLVTSAAVRDMRAARPDIAWRSVAGAPHLLLQTHAEECARIVDEFCTTLPPVGKPW